MTDISTHEGLTSKRAGLTRTAALVTATRTVVAKADDHLTLDHLRALVAECDGLPGCLPVFATVGYSDLYSPKTADTLTITSDPERTYCRADGCLDRADQVINYRPYCDKHAADLPASDETSA